MITVVDLQAKERKERSADTHTQDAVIGECHAKAIAPSWNLPFRSNIALCDSRLDFFVCIPLQNSARCSAQSARIEQCTARQRRHKQPGERR
eukprot:IDg9894t1